MYRYTSSASDLTMLHHKLSEGTKARSNGGSNATPRLLSYRNVLYSQEGERVVAGVVGAGGAGAGGGPTRRTMGAAAQVEFENKT